MTSISPTSVKTGSGDTKLTVTGTNLLSSTTVTVGGVADVTSYVSATQVVATVTASQLASGGKLSVIALNGTVSSASGSPMNLEVDNPVPTISSVSPSYAVAGTAAQIVNVVGTGFVAATVINVNGNARPTAFISGTQVNVTLSSSDISASGSLSIEAVNASPGGGTSAASTLIVVNPVPGGAITVSPSSITAGSSPVTVTVTGTNFIPSSTILVNGKPRSTTYISSTQLTFVVTATDQASTQILPVSVSNPTPVGGVTGVANLTILSQTPTPVLSQISPTQLIQGSPDTVIFVTGTGLAQQVSGGLQVLTSQIQWNSTPLKTALANDYNGTQTISATVPAAQLTTAGSASITVVSSTSTPALSNALTIKIVPPPPPTITTITPNTGPINTAQTLNIGGTGFTSASTVALNGATIPSTFVSSGQISVNLPESDVRLPGNLEFTVTTPAPGGGTSGPAAFTAYVPIVNNSMVYNPVNGLAYVTVPGTVGAPYGNSVVSVEPITGTLGKPILVGSEPDRIAVTDDGKFLWVGLDGASAVRRVNIATGAADLQFSVARNNTGWYANPATVLALAALPGSDTAVVVGTSGSGTSGSSYTIAIFDSGVMRSGTASDIQPSAFQVNGAASEIYAAQNGTYDVYTYSASGLTLKTTANNGTYAGYGIDDLQVTGGRVYTDFGTVYDSEAGALLGTFYADATTKAQGTTVAAPVLGRVFILNSSQGYSPSFASNQIQTFDLNSFNLLANNTIPVGLNSGSPGYGGSGSVSHLTRWGANGLLFRTSFGVYSLRSNLVQDLSGTSADLGVKLTSSGATATGSNTTYTGTVTNNGPASATSIALTANLPATGILVSATSTAGSCFGSGYGVTCTLGSLSANGTAEVTIVVLQTSSGSVDASAQVFASENDPVLANNQSTTTVTVSGAAYNLQPTLASIAPSGIKAGSTSDTVITVTGSGFSSGSTVELNGNALATTYTSPTELTATVPSDKLAAMGWAPITVVNSAPGGGTSNPLPLTVYSVLTIGVNHILYDPYSRQIMASVGSGSASVSGNSIAPIDPESGTVGAAVSIGSQPDSLALTSDGNILYTILDGNQSIARFNMLTGQPDFTWQVPGMAADQLRGITTQPGNENTIALDEGSWAGNAIFDFDTVNQNATMRGQATGPYTGSCIVMPTATDMLSFDTDTSGATLDHYTVTAAGFQYYNSQQYVASTLNRGGCFKAEGNRVYTVTGGVSDWTTNPATPLGVLDNVGTSMWGYNGDVLPDSSLGRTFFVFNPTSGYNSSQDGSLQAFDNTTYMASNAVSIDFAGTEGSNTSYKVVDVIRWGQDGVAILTSGGHIYLLRGAAVVPGLIGTNSSATLTSASVSTLPHGSGNTVLTLTGSNFQPGVAVTWNGGYRTTSIVDSTHVTVDIPASDLATAGTATLVATNPGAGKSGSLTITLN